MYGFLTSRFPRTIVNGVYAVWYAVLMIAILYWSDHSSVAFYYLHQ